MSFSPHIDTSQFSSNYVMLNRIQPSQLIINNSVRPPMPPLIFQPHAPQLTIRPDIIPINTIISNTLSSNIKPIETLNQSLVKINPQIELPKPVVDLKSSVSRGMIEKCYQTGFDHAFGTKKFYMANEFARNPVSEGIESGICTIKPEYNKAYSDGFMDGYNGKK